MGHQERTGRPLTVSQDIVQQSGRPHRAQAMSVSFGSFNCSLVGFNDPTNTVKDIATFFSELAQTDRQFGAVPELKAEFLPTPTAPLRLPPATPPPVHPDTAEPETGNAGGTAPAAPVQTEYRPVRRKRPAQAAPTRVVDPAAGEPAAAVKPTDPAGAKARSALDTGIGERDRNVDLQLVTRKLQDRRQKAGLPTSTAARRAAAPDPVPGPETVELPPRVQAAGRLGVRKRRPSALAVSVLGSAGALVAMFYAYLLWAIPANARGDWLTGEVGLLEGGRGHMLFLAYAGILSLVFATIWLRKNRWPGVVVLAVFGFFIFATLRLFAGIYLAHAPYCLTPLASHSDAFRMSAEVFLSFGLATGRFQGSCGFYVFSEALAAFASVALILAIPFIAPAPGSKAS